MVRPMRRSLLVRPRVGAIGRIGYVVVFVVAFAVRAWFAIRMQRPVEAIWSDMAGYVSRAEQLLAGITPGDPRVLAFWPWGTHALVAVELAVFGRESVVGIGLFQAAFGALAAPAASAITHRLVRGSLAAFVAGLAVALWFPHVAYSGFFTSELWFSTASLLATAFFLRAAEGRTGSALLAGIFLALAFVVRPQVLLSVGLVAIGLVLARLFGQRVSTFRRRAMVLLLAPLVLAIAFSSVRYFRLTGTFGMICSNGPLNRLFGATDVVKVEATWDGRDGSHWGWWFSPPVKGEATPATTETLRGQFIGDAVALERIRERRLAGVPTSARLRRMADNVVHLVDNEPWPENQSAGRKRTWLRPKYAAAVYPVLALAVLGLAVVRRHLAAAVAIVAQLVTLVVVAALYFAEARFRVPYDPFLLVLAVVGATALVRRYASRIRT